jgi:DNA-binding transcriptional ArsR family regulator
MKAFKLITDPDAFTLLGDETRRRIIYLLRAKEMTVSQIAAELNLTPQAIYHHIRKLRDAGMAEVAREERVDHFIETYYRATAELFHFSHGAETPDAYAEAKTVAALQALGRVGLRVGSNPKTVARLVDVWKRIEEIGSNRERIEAIASLDDVDFFVKQDMHDLAKILAMTDKEFQEFVDLIREERKLLRSLIEEPEKAETVAPAKP